MERRALLKCLVGLVAAPAIIKVAGIMPVKASLQPNAWNYDPLLQRWSSNDDFIDDFRFVDGTQWTDRELVSLKARGLFNNSNTILRQIDEQYHEQFGAQGAKIGDVLRIRLPSDYTVTDGPGLSLRNPYEDVQYVRVSKPTAPDKLALAAAAVAIAPAVLKTPVTRRFWSWDSAA